MEFDEETTHHAIRHLYDYAQSDDDRPLFMQVSWTHPHEPFLCRQEFWDLYEGVDIPPPAVGPMSEDDHDAHSARILKDFGMLDYDFQPEDIARARRAYYGAVSYIDHMVGQLLDTLESCGMDQNTAILFTSDHGELLGERGMWFKKHFYEPSLKVPLFLYAPWIAPQRVSTLASLVDLLPTFCGLASGSEWSSDVEQLEGTDLTTLLNGHSSPERQIFAEYLAEATPAPIFMIREGCFKFITSETDPDLLFDVEGDPCELENLAEHPDYASELARFQKEASKKWDSAALTKDILQSQKRRLLVKSAQANGQETVRWNHGEEPGEQVNWYRGKGSYNDWAFAHLPTPKKT